MDAPRTRHETRSTDLDATSGRWGGALLRPAALLVAATLAAAVVGFASIERHKASARSDAQNALQAVTQLKATQVESWRAALEHAAEMIARDPAVFAAVDLLAARRSPEPVASEHTAALLDEHRRTIGIVAVSILDGGGTALLATDAHADASGLRDYAGASLRANRLVWDDMQAAPSGSQVRVRLVAPIRNPRTPSQPPTHVVVLHVDPARFLFPFVQHWPTPSPSAETFLFRREGSEVVYLNTLRHSEAAPLSLRFSLLDERLLAAQVIRGERGAIEGLDYRGVPVVGYGRSVADSTWYLVAKTDTRELYAPIERAAGAIVFGVVALLVACALAIRSWWQTKAEARMRLYAAMFENTREAVVIADAHERIVAVNPAFSDITGYGADEIIGRTPRVLSSGRQNADFYRTMWRAIEAAGTWSGEIWNRRKDGSIYAQWQSLSVIRDRRGRATHYVAIFSDITERKSAEARMSFLAYHDPLTGLPNRALLQDRMSQALSAAQRSGHRAAVMVLDLDRFKQVNDTLGHCIGDQLLQTIATRVQASVRSHDTVCRTGGDEFVVLLASIASNQEAATVAQRILSALDAPCTLSGHEVAITMSIGVSIYPDHAEDIEALLRYADKAMYQAKKRGRNGYQFYWQTHAPRARESNELTPSAESRPRCSATAERAVQRRA